MLFGVLVCSGQLLLVAPPADAQSIDTVIFDLEKKLSGAYPSGYTADQFSFTVSGQSTPVVLTAFTADSANGTVALPVGVYTLAEIGPAQFVPGEWTVQWSGAGCDNQTGPVTTITIDATDIGKTNFGCRADNQWRYGTLRVIKQFVGTSTPFTEMLFTVTSGSQLRFDGPFDADGDNDILLAAGAYQVVEASSSNYVATYSADCVGVMTQGGNKTCTITNTYRDTGSSTDDQGVIIIEKQTTPDGDQTEFVFDPSWDEQLIGLRDGMQSTSTALVPGTYSITELATSSWTQTNSICSDGSAVNAISLSANETVTCVFYNTKRTDGDRDDDGEHIVFGYVWHDKNKNTLWDIAQPNVADDESDLDGWVVTITNGSTTLSTTTDTTGYYSFTVPAGAWVVSESLQSNWTLTFPATNQHTVTVLDESVVQRSGTVGSYLAQLLQVAIPVVYAETVVTTYGPFNFGNVFEGNGGGSGGGTGGGGQSSGSSRRGGGSGTPMPSAGPQPLVLGETASALPVGAPNTGAGGTAFPLTYALPPSVVEGRPRVPRFDS